MLKMLRPYTVFTEHYFLNQDITVNLYLDLLCCVKSHQWDLTLCDPMDCRPPGSSVHGILQARILEWVALPSSRASSQLRDQTQHYVSSIGRQVLDH